MPRLCDERTAIIDGRASAASDFIQVGTKVLRVKGFNDDSPTYSFTLVVRGWDGGAGRDVRWTFTGIPNGRQCDVSSVTPAITTLAAAPAQKGDCAVEIEAEAGSLLYVYFCQ